MASDLNDKFAALRENYTIKSHDKVADMESAWSQLREAWDEHAAMSLMRDAHSMSGTAGTYGLTTLGSAAKDVELALEDIGERAPSAEEISAIDVLIERLKESLSAAN